MTAAITAIVGVAGLIVGWFVLGTQRVTETLTVERRSAYLKVIKAASAAADEPQADHTALREAIVEAEFLASDRLARSRRISGLLQDPGTDAGKARLAEFVVLARMETQRNSSVLRWRNRRRYQDRLTG
jgi:hypothetical protein